MLHTTARRRSLVASLALSLAASATLAPACSSSGDDTSSAPSPSGNSAAGSASTGAAGNGSGAAGEAQGQAGKAAASGGGAGASAGASAGGDTGSGGDVGAGGTVGGAGAAGSPLKGPDEWNRPVTPLPDADARSKRGACEFKAGALPGETLGDAAPTEGDIPIDHFVLVMMENRSFDHYLQKLPEYGVTDVDVAPADFSNKSGAGKTVTIHQMSDYCIPDVNHEWSGVHEQVSGDKMTGFVTSNEHGGQDGGRAMGYLTPEDAPFGYFLAKSFAINDRYFCSLQGPTWPNRMFFYAATSFGITENTLAPGTPSTLFDHLDQREIDWRIYKSNTPGAGVFPQLIIKYTKERLSPLNRFIEDAKAGTLPAVSYVDPELFGNADRQSSQHPPANHQFGEQFLYDVVKAVTESPLWPRTALIITYDEHGGFYDHVVPPRACEPDDSPVSDGGELGKFDQLGVRVPIWVVSPYAKKGYVSHVVHDHTSVVRLVEARFRLPALTARDANAEALLDVFDFANPPNMTPPALPERPGLTDAQVEACAAFH